MSGEVGLGQHMLAGASSPEALALAGSLDGLRVNRENVLQVRNALKAESDRLGDLMQVNGPMLHVGECGPDPVSGPAASQFNAKIQAMVVQCNGYVQALHNAAEVLEQTARAYGYNEEQIGASFDAFQKQAPTPAIAAAPILAVPGSPR